MKNVLTFDVFVDKTETYTLTREEFDKINLENNLGLIFDNLTVNDTYFLLGFLSDEYITDTTTEHTEIDDIYFE